MGDNCSLSSIVSYLLRLRLHGDFRAVLYGTVTRRCG